MMASNVSIKEKVQQPQPQEDNELGMRINTDISEARDKIYNYSQFTAGATLMKKIKVIVKKKKIKLESLYYK